MSHKTKNILLVLRILKWCITFLWLQNQRSYVVKKSFEAVAFLMAIYLSTMTFRLQTLSIRSNIILALRCLRLSDYKLCQLCRSIIMSALRCFGHSDLKVKVLKTLSMLLSVLSVLNFYNLQL